jgi:hypothetical protein
MRSAILDYGVGAVAVFCIWFKLFLDYSDFQENQSVSWVILVLATLLWPITVPLSILELILKKTRSLKC